MFKWYSNLKISIKLVVGFVIVAIIAAVVGFVGLVNLNQIGNASKLLYEDNLLGLDKASDSEMYYLKIRLNCVKAAFSESTEEQNVRLKEMNEEIENCKRALDEYDATIIDQVDRNQFDALTLIMDDYMSMLDRVGDYLNTGKKQQAIELIEGDMGKTGDKLQAAFDLIFQYNLDSGKERHEQNMKQEANAVTTVVLVIAGGVVLAVIMGLLISRIISRPIKQMVMTAETLAKGDLNIDIGIESKDETGTLAKAFVRLIESTREQARVARMIADGDLTVSVDVRSDGDVLGRSLFDLLEKLNEIVEAIAAASDQVASGSNLVSNSSMSLSQGATEQASSIEELTASLEEISTQINQNAQNASKANELTSEAELNAIKGNSQMKEMLTAMTDINESSSNINKIIKVIDDIAFQTNILALNAAVEAARAGQHGMGFAVVAEEVRTLASKSANAVKETTEMIESSIRKVEAGTKIANNTADALNNIVEQVKNAAVLVSDIAEASKEQAISVEQTNQGIVQISQVVQTNAATSEESAAASEELSTQAAHLKELVSFFILKKSAMKKDVRQEQKAAEPIRKQKPPEARAKITLGDGEFGKY